MSIRKGPVITAVVVLLMLAVAAPVYYYLGDYIGGEVIANPVTTKQLQSDFNQQSNIFRQPIASLGIVRKPTKTVQCVIDHSNKLYSYYTCFDLYTYPYNINLISNSARKSFETNATKLDALLKQDGWVNDRPHDAVTSIADSDPYLPQNGGNGAEVPYHKNIGPVTCNIEISFQSLFNEIDEGSVNVDIFSCQETIRVFMPHFSQNQQ